MPDIRTMMTNYDEEKHIPTFVNAIYFPVTASISTIVLYLANSGIIAHCIPQHNVYISISQQNIYIYTCIYYIYT